MKQGLQALNANKRATEWADRISTCRSSGLSVREWCNEKGLSEKTYYYWQRKLFQLVSEQQRTFAEITGQSGVRKKQDIAVAMQMGIHIKVDTGFLYISQ